MRKQQGLIIKNRNQKEEPFISEAAAGEAVRLAGDWVLQNAAGLTRALRGRGDFSGGVDATGIGRMDLWGALKLQELVRAQSGDVRLSARQKKIFDFIKEEEKEEAPEKKTAAFYKSLVRLGRIFTQGVLAFYGMVVLVGQVAFCFLRNIVQPRRFRWAAIVRHIDETGFRALPIVGLLAVLISMVIAYQASMQLEKFGANIFTIDLTVISLLREMGVLITAIMVAGRSGSAFAAEIGVMKLREEVDALRTMGFDPLELLVLPRLLALLVTLPLLTFLADIVGLAGGAVISVMLLDIPVTQYLARVEMVATPTMFFVGMIKAPVFAFIITIVGCYQGLNVSGSAESVGRLTTMAVVQSIFLVIMADAFFSILFAQVGI